MRLEIRRQHGEAVGVKKECATFHACPIRADSVKQQNRARTVTPWRKPSVYPATRGTLENDVMSAECYRRRGDYGGRRAGDKSTAGCSKKSRRHCSSAQGFRSSGAELELSDRHSGGASRQIGTSQEIPWI